MLFSHAKYAMTLSLSLAIMSAVYAQSPTPGAVEAAAIALSDYTVKLKKEKAEFEMKNTCEELCKVVYNIENYNIGISSDANHFVVVLLVKPQNKMRILGGGGEYWIRKNDSTIVKFRGYE